MSLDRIVALKNTPMFGGIGDDAIRFLVERGVVVEVEAGDFFFREGESGSAAYLLERGTVSVRKALGTTDHELKQLSQGDCFGEVALLDFGKRSASVRAETRCAALELQARDLAALAGKDTEQFALIYMNLARELSRRLREADARLFRVLHDEADAAEGYVIQTL